MWHVPLVPVLVGVAAALPLHTSPAQRVTDAVAATRETRPDSTRWRARHPVAVPETEWVATPGVGLAPPEPGPAVTWKRPRMSAWGYAGIGALIGSAATIIGLVLYFEENGDQKCICGPITFVPVVAGGAAVGALIGSVTHAVRSRE